METRELKTPLVTWKLIGLIALVAVCASTGVYLYLRHTTSKFEREVETAINNPDSAASLGDTDEEIEKSIEEIKKYLLRKTPLG
jgi:hypothetical protein